MASIPSVLVNAAHLPENFPHPLKFLPHSLAPGIPNTNYYVAAVLVDNP